jgi:DNA polymerase elongation subunit (family B)
MCSFFYVLDVFDDTITPNTSQTEILLFGLVDSKRVCVRVVNVPFYIFFQVPDDFEDLDHLKNEINKNVKFNKYHCMRTHCCSSVEQEPKRAKTEGNTEGKPEKENKKIEFMCTHPCVEKIKNDKSLISVVLDAKFIMLRSCVGYFPTPKKFIQFRLARPFVSNQVCKFLYAYAKTQKWNGGEEVCDVFNDATTAFCYSYEKQKVIATGSVLDLSELKRVQTQKTTCDEEYLVDYTRLPLIDKKLPPPILKTIAFDIETGVRSINDFSDPTKDAILFISASFLNDDIGFTWRSTTLSNVSVFINEKEMLQGFLDWIKKIDPDIITGFRNNAFDWEFIIIRSKILGVPFETQLSRVKNFPLIYLNAKRQSSGKGSYTVTYIHCPGRVFHDMYPYVKQLQDKLPSNGLNDWAHHLLKEKKHEWAVIQNNVVFYGDDIKKRDEFFSYGLKDARLALALYNKTKAINNVLTQSNVVGMAVRQWLSVGVQDQLRNLARRFFWPRGFVIPKHDVIYSLDKKETIIPYYKKLPILCDYEGGLVLDPVPGLYKDPVITLDISSSYPSNMRSSNLCISTVCEPNTPGAIQYSTGYWFVSGEKQKGLFPEMLELLLNERNDAKKLKEEAILCGDTYMQEIHDILQNALKIVANSLYGATGAPESIFNCPYAAATTTARGRECLKMLLEFMKKENLEVIYGDTDSIFAVLRGKTPQEAIDIGKSLAKKINEQGVLPPLVKIVWENLKLPYLLEEKKKYASINYKSLDKPGELVQKGTIAVMSDNARIAARVFTTLMEKLMDIKTTFDELELFVRQEMYNILNYINVTKEDFIIAQTFKKEFNEYKNPDGEVHLQVIKHWKKWSPVNVPKVGDKIPYLIARIPHEKAKMGDCVRPPFMIPTVKQVDVNRFVLNKLKKPISKLLLVAGLDEARVSDIFAFQKHSFYDSNLACQNVPEVYLKPSYLDLFKPIVVKDTQPKITHMFKKHI